MGIINDLDKHNSKKTVEYFIDTKVDDLIARSVSEGKRREQFENKVADNYVNPGTEEGLEYLSSIADFSDFPKYSGRGIQDAAPSIEPNTLTMWFSDVEKGEVEDFIAKIVNAGFIKDGPDYIKEADGKKLIMSIDYAVDKLRIFYKKA